VVQQLLAIDIKKASVAFLQACIEPQQQQQQQKKKKKWKPRECSAVAACASSPRYFWQA
jgi:hypothetical protein